MYPQQLRWSETQSNHACIGTYVGQQLARPLPATPVSFRQRPCATSDDVSAVWIPLAGAGGHSD